MLLSRYKAASRRDNITLRAIEDAPPFEARFKIDANTKQQAKMIRARLENPQAFATLKELQSLDSRCAPRFTISNAR